MDDCQFNEEAVLRWEPLLGDGKMVMKDDGLGKSSRHVKVISC